MTTAGLVIFGVAFVAIALIVYLCLVLAYAGDACDVDFDDEA